MPKIPLEELTDEEVLAMRRAAWFRSVKPAHLAEVFDVTARTAELAVNPRWRPELVPKPPKGYVDLHQRFEPVKAVALSRVKDQTKHRRGAKLSPKAARKEQKKVTAKESWQGVDFDALYQESWSIK